MDRSKLAEPVVLIADRGYEAYNNMAHIEQKGWKYLIRVKDRQGILSGLRLPDALEFAAVFSLMYVFTKPPPRFSPGGGYVGGDHNEI